MQLIGSHKNVGSIRFFFKGCSIPKPIYAVFDEQVPFEKVLIHSIIYIFNLTILFGLSNKWQKDYLPLLIWEKLIIARNLNTCTYVAYVDT